MRSEHKQILFQVGLFVTTFITTTLAGTQWLSGRSVFMPDYNWQDFSQGLQFSIPLLLILTVHEFGHYFVAMFHKVKASLPYYIPIPPIPFLLFNIGTMGAVIRLKSKPESNVQNFDIGVAGPLAGFIVALFILFYGFKTLPPQEYIFQFHPEYEQFGPGYADVVYSPEYLKKHQPVFDVQIGTNLIFWFFEKTVADPSRIPNPHEIMHYPVLMACYIALFVTCLNLLPIGQLDGGHVIYGLFGFKIHRMIALTSFIALMFYAGLGLQYIDPALPQQELLIGIGCYLLFLFLAFRGLRLPVQDTVMYVLLMFAFQFTLMVYVPGIKGYEGWLFFAFILGRFIGIEHPPSDIEKPLDANRVILGWIALIIFILCFSPAPLQIELITG
ncbi:MAG: site-2 protease family protein [Cyclobacteriaceae bacterium]